jgi:hypothetical protein
MELKDFISKTLSEISIGIREGNVESQKDNHSYVASQEIKVEFDVNVSSEDNSTTGGGGKITVAGILNGSLNKESKTTNSNFSHIKFSLYMNFNSEARKK